MNGNGGIVRWEILKGLPAEGPAPKYLHMGHPTPWAEGFVVRFWNEDGTEWVGNFQAQWGEGSVFDLPGSTSLIVIAYGACYLVPKSDPERYICQGSGVSSALVCDEQQILVVAHQGGDLVAYGPSGTKAWVRDGLAVDGIRLQSCIDGIITADIEYDYDGSWHTVRIRAEDGTDLQDGRQMN
jgi:hypothetical protein